MQYLLLLIQAPSVVFSYHGITLVCLKVVITTIMVVATKICPGVFSPILVAISCDRHHAPLVARLQNRFTHIQLTITA